MLNKIIRSCLFYSGTRWCPRCIAFDSRIYCEKEQLGGFLWRTFYYAVKKDPYLSKDPVICLMEKEIACIFTSFIRYIFPTLALSKSGFRVETESRLLSAGFHQLPVSNIKVVLVLLCIRRGENARENSETVVSGRKIRRNFSVATLRTSQVHFSVVKWAKSDVALCGGKGEKGYGRKSH